MTNELSLKFSRLLAGMLSGVEKKAGASLIIK